MLRDATQNLIVGALDGDPSASGTPDGIERCSDEEFQELLGASIEPAYRLALRLSGNPHDAEDFVQDAALRAYRFRDRFARGTSFSAWFYRILVNLIYSRARTRRDEQSYDSLADAHDWYLFTRTSAAGIAPQGDDPLGGTIARMTADQVAAALASLPDDYRMACALYFMDDLSYQEIADILGVPVGTVRSRLHRGRKMLQKQLWQTAHDLGIVGTAEGVGA
jgi:RNA polymerase sigma-70 factor (ECF subfamily)